MGHNVVEAELSGPNARVRVQTYRYETPSEQVRRPSQHQLALIVSRNRRGPASYFGRLESGRSFSLGELLYIPAGQEIWGRGPGGLHSLVTCSFPRGANKALTVLERAWDDASLARCADIRSEWMSASMRRLAQEAVNPGFGADILLDNLANALPIELLAHVDTRRPTAQPNKGGLPPRQLRLIEDYVREWPGGPVKVSDLATLAGYSRGHFMRAFKQATGKTVYNFVEEARLELAKTMLVDQDKPLKQIAARLGFADPSSFSLAFRRMTGFTPGRYRALGKGSTSLAS